MSDVLARPAQSPGPKLNEAQKRAIVGEVIAGFSKTEIAQRFRIHRNSVHNLVKGMQIPQESALSQDWRKQFEQLTPTAVGVIQDALCSEKVDLKDRASIAQTHLKGVKVYAGDEPGVHLYFAAARELPANWRDEYVSADDITVTVSDTVSVTK